MFTFSNASNAFNNLLEQSERGIKEQLAKLRDDDDDDDHRPSPAVGHAHHPRRPGADVARSSVSSSLIGSEEAYASSPDPTTTTMAAPLTPTTTTPTPPTPPSTTTDTSTMISSKAKAMLMGTNRLQKEKRNAVAKNISNRLKEVTAARVKPTPDESTPPPRAEPAFNSKAAQMLLGSNGAKAMGVSAPPVAAEPIKRAPINRVEPPSSTSSPSVPSRFKHFKAPSPTPSFTGGVNVSSTTQNATTPHEASASDEQSGILGDFAKTVLGDRRLAVFDNLKNEAEEMFNIESEVVKKLSSQHDRLMVAMQCGGDSNTLDVKFEIPRSPSSPGFLNINALSLGNINPDLYKDPEEGDLSEYPDGHKGRLWFTLEYDEVNENLHLTINKARNLATRDANHLNTCDPFVRVSLLPDHRRTADTKIRRKCSNPTFDESMSFPISASTLDTRQLKLNVIDVDLMKRHASIGVVIFPLADYTICKQKRLTVWRDLKIDEAETTGQMGEIRVGLCYNVDVERLTVTVVEAKHLKTESGDPIDTYVRVVSGLGTKVMKTKKLKTVKRSLDPVFNESVDFKIARDKLDNACITVQVLHAKGDRSLGRVILASALMARGKPLTHWQMMCAQSNENITESHFLSE